MKSYVVEEDKTLPEDQFFVAKLMDVQDAEVPYVDKKTGESKTFEKLKWKFEILEGEFEGTAVYGDTNARITASPLNKFYNWSCALLGRDQLGVGQSINPHELVGLNCELSVVNTPSKDKSRMWSSVDVVMPHAATTAKIPF